MPTDTAASKGQKSPRRRNGVKTRDPDIEGQVLTSQKADASIRRPAPATPPDTEGPVLTSQEAAKLLKVKEEVVAAEAEAGRLPGRKLGDQWRFGRAAVIDWLNQPTAMSGHGRQVSGPTTAPEFVETPEEKAAFLASLRAARDEVNRIHGCGEYAPE